MKRGCREKEKERERDQQEIIHKEGYTAESITDQALRINKEIQLLVNMTYE